MTYIKGMAATTCFTASSFVEEFYQWHCLTTAMDLKDAAAFLATHYICGAPVVDNDGRVVAVALLVNNLAPARRYPEFWW